MVYSKKRITKALIRLRRSAGWFVPELLANTEDRFSRVEAHIMSDHFLYLADGSEKHARQIRKSLSKSPPWPDGVHKKGIC